jgi:hypothetical protein
MMTPFHDLFVGIVAMLVGCLLVAGAIFQNSALLSLAKSRFLIDAVGKTPARWIIASIGAACIVLGTLIASGWRIHW